MKKHHAIFPLSADPITYGHLDILKRAQKFFDLIKVVVLENRSKSHLFSLEERVRMTRACLKNDSGLIVETYDGLLADYVLREGIFTIIRGIRNGADLEYENFMEFAHRKQQQELEFFYLLAREKFRNIRSSLVKPILMEYGSINEFVPSIVKRELESKYLKQEKILLTGGVASGKSYLVENLLPHLAKQGVDAHHIDFDLIVADIYREMNEGQWGTLQKKMVEYFDQRGDTVVDKKGRVAQKLVSKAVFKVADQENIKTHLDFLEKVLSPFILTKYRSMIKDLQGIILLNAPVDSLSANHQKKSFDVLKEVNYRVLLVDVPEEIQIERLMKKYRIEAIEAEIKAKANSSTIKRTRLQRVVQEQEGDLIIYVNDHPIKEGDLEAIREKLLVK